MSKTMHCSIFAEIMKHILHFSRRVTHSFSVRVPYGEKNYFNKKIARSSSKSLVKKFKFTIMYKNYLVLWNKIYELSKHAYLKEPFSKRFCRMI